jgi:hypothetical protein
MTRLCTGHRGHQRRLRRPARRRLPPRRRHILATRTATLAHIHANTKPKPLLFLPGRFLLAAVAGQAMPCGPARPGPPAHSPACHPALLSQLSPACSPAPTGGRARAAPFAALLCLPDSVIEAPTPFTLPCPTPHPDLCQTDA